ncbi:MAG: hypothetical protein ACI4SE_00595 [Lachnospiraceae bacterium]
MAKKNKDVAAQATTNQEKKKNPTLRLIIFLVELVLIIVGIVGAVQFIKKYNDPKLTAENYFKALLAGDYATAYGYLEPAEEENAFINQSTYATAMASLEIAGCEDYEIFSEGNNVYSMSYDNGYVTIKLHEQDEKRYLLFKDYEVELQDIYAEDVTITAPKDVTITMNGLVLDSSNCRIGEEDYLSDYETSYTIDRMYIGDYIVEVSGADVYQPYTDKLEVSPYSTYFYVSQPYLAEDLADTLIERSYNTLEVVYQDAINQEETCAVLEEAKAYDLVDPSYLQNGYDSIKYDLYIYDGFFESVDLSDFTGEIDYYSYDYESGDLEITLTLEFYEDYTYQTLDWWTDRYEQSSDSGYGDATFEYRYVDGEWVLTYFYVYSSIYAW